MQKIIAILCLVFCFGNHTLWAQEKNTSDLKVIDTTSVSKLKSDPLRPAKAAFYSAVVPGLGQAYNKKYWKIPIVYGAIGTGIYLYNHNNQLYNEYRDAYKRRLAGFTDDQFYGQYNDATLVNAQKQMQRNKNLSLVFTVGMYILNILDANVDAHLMQFNVNNNLSVKPDIYQNQLNYKQSVGLTLNYNF